MDEVEPKPEFVSPIDVGAYEAARHDLNEAMAANPQYVQERFIALMRSDRELGMSILGSAQNAFQNGEASDQVFIEVVVTLFDAIVRTNRAKELESELDYTTAV